MLTAIAQQINLFVKRSASLLSWLFLLLVAVITAQVLLRRGLSAGMVALEELQWYLYAIALMFGAAYAQVVDAHVRVDLLRARFSAKTRSLIEIFGLALLMLPFLAIVIYHSIDFVATSYRISERSVAPAGLPYRWLIKSVIPLSFGLWFLAIFARICEEIASLRPGNDTHGT